MPEITGQIFVRETSMPYNINLKNKRLVIVAGIIAVDDIFPLEGECQYVIVGETQDIVETKFVNLNIIESTKIKVKEKGLTIDGMLLSPIWRV